MLIHAPESVQITGSPVRFQICVRIIVVVIITLVVLLFVPHVVCGWCRGILSWTV